MHIMRSTKTKKVNNAVKSLKQINWKSTADFRVLIIDF